MNQYERSITIDGFTGICQDGDGVNLNLKYATDAQNTDTQGGTLRPMRGGLSLGNLIVGDELVTDYVFSAADESTWYANIGISHISAWISGLETLVWHNTGNDEYKRLVSATGDPVVLEWTAPLEYNPTILQYNIGTLMHLYRRQHPTPTERDILVAISNNKVYYRLMTATAWTETEVPVIGTPAVSAITSNDFDYVSYEVLEDGFEFPTDILLFTNATDGMFAFNSRTNVVSIVATPYKFGSICRHYERIWGTGVEDKPDVLAYSAPYDPFDWAQNSEIPEDGGGEILQPSWDGDRFVAFRTFGSQLLAFKRSKIWRILGMHPGEYVMKEQYGGGAIIENTIVVNNDFVLMLGYNGLMLFDGTIATDFYQSWIKDIMARVTPGTINYARAAMRGGNIYCLSLALDGSTDNNALLEYDIRNKSFNLRYGVFAESFVNIENKLYYTSSIAPGAVLVLGDGPILPVKWVTGWQDMGAKNIVKSGFVVYFAMENTAEVPVEITIETEKRTKTKTYTVPTGGKMKRLRLSNIGRRFRLIFEAPGNVDFMLLGGLQIMMEVDED